MSIRFHNSLTRKIEEFQPYDPNCVRMYTCGPTVYHNLSIGNFRTFVTSDILRRILEYDGYTVKSVMNITDVGHLTGDGDLGEDKIANAAKKHQKTAWEIAKFYTQVFVRGIKELNIKTPSVMPKATEHIKEQIRLIRILEEKGLTYETSDGVYFDTIVYEENMGKKYGELSTLDQIKTDAQVEKNLEKKNPRDFALWKFSYPGGRLFDPTRDDAVSRRHMEWESPWGIGFPGWHIECSAMSMKYLGPSFDIHIGGEDLRQTHHPNEIAQSEAATGKLFVRYWLHATFLLVDGRRMGRSLGNIYTISDVAEKGFDPLSLRYLYLTAHYRDPLNFTWESLADAQRALEKIRNQIASLYFGRRTKPPNTKHKKILHFKQAFVDAINDDLNTPRALAVFWSLLKNDIEPGDKYNLLLSFDKVFGLRLREVSGATTKVPNEINLLLKKREILRKKGQFKEGDVIRKKIQEMGYLVKDTKDGPVAKRWFYKGGVSSEQ